MNVLRLSVLGHSSGGCFNVIDIAMNDFLGNPQKKWMDGFGWLTSVKTS